MTTDPATKKAPDLHDLEPPGDAHGTFRRLPYGMTYEAKINPGDDRTITVEYAYDSTDFVWTVRMKFSDSDLADDIFRTTDERVALMWFGHACYKIEEEAVKQHAQPDLPAQLMAMLNSGQAQVIPVHLPGTNCNHDHGHESQEQPAIATGDERTGQYL